MFIIVTRIWLHFNEAIYFAVTKFLLFITVNDAMLWQLASTTNEIYNDRIIDCKVLFRIHRWKNSCTSKKRNKKFLHKFRLKIPNVSNETKNWKTCKSQRRKRKNSRFKIFCCGLDNFFFNEQRLNNSVFEIKGHVAQPGSKNFIEKKLDDDVFHIHHGKICVVLISMRNEALRGCSEMMSYCLMAKNIQYK